MRQVIVESEVGALCVYKRKTIADNRVAAEGLLHAEYRLKAPDPTVETAKRLRAVVGFNPVALGVMTARKLGAQSKGGIRRFPPDVHAIEVLTSRSLRSLQQSIVRKTYFKTTGGQVQTGPNARGALGVELLVSAAGGKPCCIVEGVFGPRDGGPAQHSAESGAGGHCSKAGNQRTILEIADPDFRQAFVIGSERNQEAAADDGDMRRCEVIPLKIYKADDAGMVVARLAVTFGEILLEQDGPRFDEKAIADRRSQQRLNSRLIGCVAPIGAGKEADTTGDKWCILCASIPDHAEQSQSEGDKLRGPGHFGERKAQYRTRHKSHSSERCYAMCLWIVCSLSIDCHSRKIFLIDLVALNRLTPTLATRNVARMGHPKTMF